MAETAKHFRKLFCSFCGKDHSKVMKLIAGPTSYICDECVLLCVDIINEERAFDRITKTGKLLVKPEDIERLNWMRTWTCFEPSHPAKGEGGGDG